MNDALAVKGSNSNNGTIQEIQEQAFLEVQRFLTTEELSLLKNKYSLSQLVQNIIKVSLDK